MACTVEITFKEFRRRYNSEDACRAELFRLRFLNGFVCPKRGCVELLATPTSAAPAGTRPLLLLNPSCTVHVFL